MKQKMNEYTQTDQLVWKTLFERQNKNLAKKGSSVYYNCLQNMRDVLHPNAIPNFEKINDWFITRTGWEIKVVPGLIPVEDFFDLLAEKRFCSSTWLRSMEQLDYLEEPDMFHDIFGHIPLLSHPDFSEFAHSFGKIGRSFKNNKRIVTQLQRLYWFTIEFGVIREQNEIKSYGAGIMSSYGETNRVADQTCNFISFDTDQILKKVFQTDVLQEDYFILESFEQLAEAIQLVDVYVSREILL